MRIVDFSNIVLMTKTLILLLGGICLGGCASASTSVGPSISATNFSCYLGEQGNSPQYISAAVVKVSGISYLIYDSHALPLNSNTVGEITTYEGTTYKNESGEYDYSNISLTQGPDPGDITIDIGNGKKSCRHAYPKMTPIFPPGL
jgi:hypothetical protein|tara:strand:- start:119 stop:556 length:438 start_codon:yes stop_codon:yes gene_type:complete